MTTFLLLHGGGMGGWTWKYVREILEAGGHKVYTPCLLYTSPSPRD